MEPCICKCDEPTCSKCLLVSCKDDACQVHTRELKDRRQNRQKWHIVPQTLEQTEENRRKIEKLRAEGVLQKHEKTFKIHDDGTVEQL